MTFRGSMVAPALACVCVTAAAGSARGSALVGGEGPVWSPDGTQIAYIAPAPTDFVAPKTGILTHVAGLDRVVAVAADGSGAQRVLVSAPRDTTLVEVRWAAGGRIVYQISDLFSLRSVDPATGAVTRIGTVGSPVEAFTLSSDGREVAFTAPCGCRFAQTSAVHVGAASGGRVHSLPRPANASDGNPSFSPDGTRVVFSRTLFGKSAPRFPDSQSILVEPTRGGPTRSLHVHGDSPVWSPDGKWIAFVGLRGKLELVPASGGTARTLLTAGAAAFSWSPDSTTIDYASSTKIGTVDLSGKTTTFALPGLRPGFNTPQWSPDGGSIAFTAIARSSDHDIRVYVIAADGSGLRRIA